MYLIQLNLFHTSTQFDLNHLGNYFKADNVSDILNNVAWVIMESFKCQLVFSGSHYMGGFHDEEWDGQIAVVPNLVYGDLGNEHRTITQGLQLLCVQKFIHDGKENGGFYGDATLEVLKTTVWNNFGFDPEDVLACTEAEYNNDQATSITSLRHNDGGRIHQRIYRKWYWTRTLTMILIKLSIKCGNPKCNRCFMNLRRTQRSAVNLHHLNKRTDINGVTFSHAEQNFSVDDYIKCLKEGDADVWCVPCHDGETKQGR